MESRDSKLIVDGRGWKVDGRAQAPSRPRSGFGSFSAAKIISSHPITELHFLGDNFLIVSGSRYGNWNHNSETQI